MANAAGADWADGLPYELMVSIFERMETFDRARFACVCPRWRLVAKVATLRRPFLPWMLLPPASDGDKGTGICSFHGFPSPGVAEGRRSCNIGRHLQFIWRSCVGSSPYGWVVVLGKNRQLSLVNILSRDTRSLPGIDRIPEISIRFRSRPTPKEYGNFLFHYFKKAIVFELPRHGLLMAAVPDSHLHWLVIAKVGGETWAVSHMPVVLPYDDFVEDIAIHGGVVYGLTNLGSLLACDVLTNLSAARGARHPLPTTIYQVLDLPPLQAHLHLVSHFMLPDLPSSSTSSYETTAGLLLILRYCREGDDNEASIRPVRVVRLEQVSSTAFRCLKNDVVSSLGGHSIFLDERCCCTALPVGAADECPDMKPDLIYYTRLCGAVCKLDVLNLSGEVVETHRLAGVDCTNRPSSIWYWPVTQI